MNPREQAQAITDLAGIEGGGKNTEAFTRFFRRGSRTGWNSLTQDDFAMVEDAFADAAGGPRRKRKHPLVWKIGFWWHWHVTSPIIYPLIEAPFTACRKIYWHAWRKRHGGEVMVPDWRDDGEAYIAFMPWVEANAQRRQLVANLPLRHRIADRLNRLHVAWGWCCPDCGIDFAEPEHLEPRDVRAFAALDAHVAEAHGGAAPEEAEAAQLFWI